MARPTASAPPAVLVTRPQPEADRWVARLASRGLCARALPLITLRPLADPAPLAQAWSDLAACAAVMFVSRAAVEHWFAQRPSSATSSWPPGTRAWATGGGTADALALAGVPRAQVDVPPPDSPQFDSEALWALVQGQAQPGRQALIVRGADGDGAANEDGGRETEGSGRDWLGERLRERGMAVRRVAAYERAAPDWDAATAAMARAGARDGTLWLFTSSQALAHLQRLLPGQDWSGAQALATHTRIAQALREAGFGTVRTTRPDLASVVASIESSG